MRTDETRADLGRQGKRALALACVAGGVVPLAARWTSGEAAKIVYGTIVAAGYLAFTLYAKRSPSLGRFWQLSFGFFVFAFVQLLNNSIPYYVGRNVLHQPPVHGNPLASTVSGTLAIQLIESAIAIVPILLFTRLAGQDFGSIYVQRGRLGRPLRAGVIVFVVLFVVTVRSPAHHMLKTNGTLTSARVLALAPALVVMALSNGFQEELLFRGLFLRKYGTFFGPLVANVLQATIFAVAHIGIGYSANELLFIVLIVFPFGLVAGHLVQRTDSILVPGLIHAGADLPIYLGFLSFVR